MFKRVQRRITRFGGLAAPIGALAAAFAAFTLWFLFALKDFSSAVRDAYEAPPRVTQHIAFCIACVSLVVLFVAGIVMVVLALRRRGRQTISSRGTR